MATTLGKAVKIPKAVAEHPGVESCEIGYYGGVEDYLYSVWLRPGWVFGSGRNAGCRGLNFNTVREFRQAEPAFKGALKVAPMGTNIPV